MALFKKTFEVEQVALFTGDRVLIYCRGSYGKSGMSTCDDRIDRDCSMGGDAVMDTLTYFIIVTICLLVWLWAIGGKDEG